MQTHGNVYWGSAICHVTFLSGQHLHLHGNSRSNVGSYRARIFSSQGIQLKNKTQKVAFFQTSVTFLGHILSADGVSPNLEKVAKIKDWPTPKTPKEVHSFVGLASYYRRFIPNFAKRAGPLHALIIPASFKQKICRGEMKKSDLPEFQWTSAYQEGFDQLKKALTEAPVLAYPDYSKLFILETDASLKGLGTVLSQKGDDNEIHVIAYASRSL